MEQLVLSCYSYGSWVSNLSCQTWLQALLPVEPAGFLVFDDRDSFEGHHLASLWGISLYDIFVINTLDYILLGGGIYLLRGLMHFSVESLDCLVVSSV